MHNIDGRNRRAFGTVTAPQTVRIERVLPGPIERVWAYLTEPDKRRTWLAAGPMELRVGGKVELHFDHATLSPQDETPPEKYAEMEGCHHVPGEVTRCEPPHVLSYSWAETGANASEVTFELTPQDDAVLLVITHRRLPDRGTMISVAAGWHNHVDILCDVMEGVEPPPFWATHMELEAEYEKRIPAE
jgi:uncharacterized protein YndB with AHSA1/START domain